MAVCLALASCAGTRGLPAPVVERIKQTTEINKESSTSTSKSNTSISAQNKKNLSAHQYEVVKGDTLYSIGKKLGIPHQTIAETNHIENNAIYVGQILNISAESVQNSQSEHSNVVIQPLTTTEMPVATETKPIIADSQVIDIESRPDQNIEWRWPTKGKLINDYDKEVNKGIDIAGNIGQPILAAGAGKVIYSGTDIRGYGKLVIVKHNRNYLSVYAYQGNLLVKEGQFVSVNEKIAEMGRSNTAAQKLHFEIRKNGKTVDPKEYLPNS